MKKINILLILVICITLTCGCSRESTLRCTNVFKSQFKNVKEEDIEVKLIYKDDKETPVKAEKTITATLSSDKLSDKEKKEAQKSLKQNYCNSELKDDYKCESEIKGNKIIIKETGTIKQLMGEIKDYSLKYYNKILTKKDYTCTEK